MLKAIAVQEIRIEEGFFPKGTVFAPGYSHNPDYTPKQRILHLNCMHRAAQLMQEKVAMVLDIEEDDNKHQEVLEELNEERRLFYNGILQPLQDVPDTLSDSSADPEPDSCSGC